ncbi:putative Diguanylate cyclase [Sterolibacterium denitrificans]|uniref:Diguanylate cyclase n=1 Tax=Sterolibacterium denitrificans TaxID=157592 RepID=A0A7Z7MWI0_9PROT|nr:EAL domain-containing protein [Sterolibacterium denitrificans]SMB32330.1 putative Diguanylate cyclase [Sterolibacterium denitrificans]
MKQSTLSHPVSRADAIRWAGRIGWAMLAVLVAITLSYWYFGVAEILGGPSKVKELMLVSGLLISVLVFGLTLALIHIRELAQYLMDDMHASLKQSEERWSLALEGIKAGITDWDIPADFVQYSKGWYDIVEFAEGEVGHRPDGWMQRIHPDDMPRLTEQLQDMLAGKLANPKHEFRMLTKDGRVKWVLGHAIITHRDAAGKPLRLIGVNIDITDRKRAEATRDALLEAHVDAGVGLFALRDGRMVFVNPAIATITGYSIDELYAVPNVIDVGVHPDERERIQRKHDKRLAGNMESSRYETSIVTKSGERREIELAVTLTPNSPDFDVLGIVTDITERKQLAARLQEGHDLLTKISAHVPGVIFQFRLDPDGRISYPFVSDSVQDLYGLSAAEIREDAHRVSAFLHPDDAEAVMGAFHASARNIEPWHLEYRLERPGRGTCWVLTEAKPEKLPDGSIVWHGITTDITEIKNMQEALHNSEERFRSLTQMSADWYWEQDENYRFTEISGGAAYGQVKAISEQTIGKTRWEILSNHDDPEALARHRERIEKRKSFRNFEFSIPAGDGQSHIISISGEPHFDATGRFMGYRGVGSDVTERKRIEEELRLAAMVYESSSEAMSVTGADGRVITVNPAFTQITGWEAEEVIGHRVRIFNIDADMFKTIKSAIDTTGHWHGELWNHRKNGDIYPALISINTIFDENGQPYRYVALFSDITNRKQTEELIWRQANFDALTQLPNRSMFHERVGQEIKKARRAGTQLALLFIDLDRFKEVNDTLGHDTGDHLLLEAAQRIVGCVRETDAVARLGGDEFTVLLADLAHGDNVIVERIARDILDSLANPFLLGEDEVYVSASIGITLYPEDADRIDEMFRNADQAMYLSKTLGRNRYSYFTPELQASAQNRLRLITDLRGAIAGEQFRVYFQPVIELATGRIVKAEALLRWQHPQRGMVMPDEFIPLIEETGMIHEIGEWVFREAVHWAQRWRTGRHSEFQISVNKSPVQFQKEANGHIGWLAHLEELGLPGNTIAIEITEGLLLDADPAIVGALLGCRDVGIQVALDDFGTGYSSLAYLNRFDIDYLKIDKSFIGNLTDNPGDMALSEAIIVMAHKLGLKVIAEGVETAAQRDLLASVGCDYGQGYLFSRPLPPEAFEALLLDDKCFA